MEIATIEYIEIIIKVIVGLMLIFFGAIGYHNSKLFWAALFGTQTPLYRKPRREAPFWEKYK